MINKIKTTVSNWFGKQLAKNLNGLKMLLRVDFATKDELDDVARHYGTIISAIALAVKANPSLIAKGLINAEARTKLDEQITIAYEKLIDVPVKDSKKTVKKQVVKAVAKKAKKTKGK